MLNENRNMIERGIKTLFYMTQKEYNQIVKKR